MHGAGRAANHEEGVCGANCLRHQILCFCNHGNRIAQIVQWFHAVYIKADTLLTQELGQLRIATASFMTGYVEGNDSFFLEIFKRLINRRFRLSLQIQSIYIIDMIMCI